MTEGIEENSAGPAPAPGAASPTGPPRDAGPVPEEKPEEMEAAGESGDEGEKGIREEGGGAEDEGHAGALGIMAVPATCCVCINVEHVNNCLHSEKICILPILACLLSLALCTAGLKWVFVDRIFQYEPPTHLDPKPIGQDPIIISVNPTLGITVSIPHSSPSTVSLTTTIAISPTRPDAVTEEKSTAAPHLPPSSKVTYPSVTLKYNAERPTVSKQSPRPQTTQDNNIIQTISTTSISTTAKSSSHIMRCSDRQKNYCVNGGECFTLEIMPGSTKFLCRCPNEFTGDRCQNYVMASFYKAEELYQKRILTIAGICIALLVVGIMCVVAYCKTKKQRKKLRDRLRQSQKKKRKNNTSTGNGSNLENSTAAHQNSNVPLQDLKLVNQSNGALLHHATEETETTFPTSKYAAANPPTTLTNISSQSWSEDWSVSVLSDAESFSAMSLAENRQRATQGVRGRLNATGGTSDLAAYSGKGRDTSQFNKSWLKAQAAVRSLAPTSPEPKTPAGTPGSPLSEMSAPASGLGVSVPSVTLSPSVEDQRPLLLSKRSQHQTSLKRADRKRSFSSYNHGVRSLPPSPALNAKNSGFPGDSEVLAASHSFSELPEELSQEANHGSNCSARGAARHVLHFMESSGDSLLFSESEGPQGGDAPFLAADSTTALWEVESCRTYPMSPNRHLLTKAHNPIAV